MTTTKDQATLLKEWQDAANAWRVAMQQSAPAPNEYPWGPDTPAEAEQRQRLWDDMFKAHGAWIRSYMGKA